MPGGGKWSLLKVKNTRSRQEEWAPGGRKWKRGENWADSYY